MRTNCVSQQQINSYANYVTNFNKPVNFTGLNLSLNNTNIGNKIKGSILPQKLKKTNLNNKENLISTYKNSIGKIIQILFGEKPLSLEKHLNFVLATNIEDAVLFAKEKLKIINYNIDDLDFANSINAALVTVANVFEGNVYFPETIDYTDNNEVYAFYNLAKDCLCINKNLINNAQEDLEEIIEENSYSEAITGDFGYGYKTFCKQMKQAYKNPSKLTVFDKYSLLETHKNKEELIENIGKKVSYQEKINLNPQGPIYEDFQSLIFHEVGHCFYDKSISIRKTIRNQSLFNSWKKPPLMLENTRESASEFVADIFAGKVRGEKFSEEVEKMFKEFTGLNF